MIGLDKPDPNLVIFGPDQSTDNSGADVEPVTQEVEVPTEGPEGTEVEEPEIVPEHFEKLGEDEAEAEAVVEESAPAEEVPEEVPEEAAPVEETPAEESPVEEVVPEEPAPEEEVVPEEPAPATDEVVPEEPAPATTK